MKYTGERNSSGERHGQGIMTYVDGSKYTGEWQDGEMHGQGAMTYAGGRTFTGVWKDGERVP